MPMVSIACRPISATVPARRRGRRAVVGQHGHPGGGQPGQLLAALGAVRRRQVGRVLARCCPRAPTRLGEPQQPAQVVVDDRLGDLAGLGRRATSASPHGPSGPGMTRSRPPFAAGPAVLVANQSDMISPSQPHSPLSDLVVHVVLLGGGDAVDVVVGGHHRPRVRLVDRDLERQQVQLAQRGLVEHAVHGVAVGLGLVRDEVLEAGADAARPAARGRRRRRACRSAAGPRSRPRRAGRRAGERCRLIVGPSTTWISWASASSASRRADLVRGVLAPGGGQQGGVGEQRHHPAAAELQPAHPGRAVGQPQLGQADRRLGREREASSRR